MPPLPFADLRALAQGAPVHADATAALAGSVAVTLARFEGGAATIPDRISLVKSVASCNS